MFSIQAPIEDDDGGGDALKRLVGALQIWMYRHNVDPNKAIGVNVKFTQHDASPCESESFMLRRIHKLVSLKVVDAMQGKVRSTRNQR